ncbi:hypothetical protein ACWDTT_15945 [Streptosporangium sandarakinum]
MSTTTAGVEVPVAELVVGDIVEERYSEHDTTRKIVIKVTDKSAVFRTETGQDGRQAKTRRVKGKTVDATARRIGHYDLTPETLRALRDWYQLGELTQSRFRHGVAEGLPRFWDLFGYGEGETSPWWNRNPDRQVMDEVYLAGTGDRLEIIRYDDTKTYQGGQQIRRPSWGVDVLDPEHGHKFATIGWRYRDRLGAEEAVRLFTLARRRGMGLEDAMLAARYLAADTVPRVDDGPSRGA